MTAGEIPDSVQMRDDWPPESLTRASRSKAR